MARPAEKARAMLNKWVKMREEGNAPVTNVRGKRPHLASECEHLGDAEFYRNQINREITGMIAKIQNPALGEHTLRDLNDEINRKFREKHHWNKRIFQLSNGTIDYNKTERSARIEEGDVQFLVESNYGKRQGPIYRYFGAAKDLPGVKELLEQQQEKMRAMHRKKRGPNEIYKHVGVKYFGWRDEEDGVLLELEDAAFQEYKESQKRQKTASSEASEPVEVDLENLLSKDYLEDVPSMEETKKIMLAEKKKALLAKFSI
jgi:pre-mRNA-splicing factor ISY1